MLVHCKLYFGLMFVVFSGSEPRLRNPPPIVGTRTNRGNLPCVLLWGALGRARVPDNRDSTNAPKTHKCIQLPMFLLCESGLIFSLSALQFVWGGGFLAPSVALLPRPLYLGKCPLCFWCRSQCTLGPGSCLRPRLLLGTRQGLLFNFAFGG